MKKSKTVFVTALIAVMLAAIVAMLYLLKLRVYLIIVGVLGVYGYLCAARHFCRWLGKEPPITPPSMPAHPHVEKREDNISQLGEEGAASFESTYDAIVEELAGDPAFNNI